MTGAALALVLLAGFAHASWNLLAKRVGAGGLPFVWCYAGVEVALVTPIAVMLLMRDVRLDGAMLTAALASGILHSVYFLLLQRAYASGELSVVYPVARGLGPMLAVIGAVALLNERPPLLAYVGAVAVSAGVFWLASVGRPSPAAVAEGRWSGVDRHSEVGARRLLAVPGLGLAVATGASIASYTLWDGFAVGTLAAPPLVFFWGASTTRFVVLTVLVVLRRSPVGTAWRNHRREVLGIGALSPLSYILVLFAFTLAPIAFVAPAREISIVIAALFGILLLDEPKALPRLSAASVIVGGVALLGIA